MTRASRTGAKLSELEATVLRLTAEGHNYPAIGALLGRSAAAIQDAAQRANMKLGARSAANAVYLACQAGILDGRPRRHGDHAGYTAHVRAGEDPWACKQGCPEGERAYRTERRKARRAREAAQAPASRPEPPPGSPSRLNAPRSRQKPAEGRQSKEHAA